MGYVLCKKSYCKAIEMVAIADSSDLLPSPKAIKNKLHKYIFIPKQSEECNGLRNLSDCLSYRSGPQTEVRSKVSQCQMQLIGGRVLERVSSLRLKFFSRFRAQVGSWHHGFR